MWQRSDDLRSRFKAAGFGVPDHFAQLVSRLSSGGFSADRFIQVANTQAQTYVNETGQGQSPNTETLITTMLLPLWQGAGPASLLASVVSPLIAGKIDEIDKAAIGVQEVRTRNDLRRYAEKSGSDVGYVLNRSFETDYVRRPMFLKVGRVSGYFFVGRGRRSYTYLDSTAVLFAVSRDGENRWYTPFNLEILLPGMKYYDIINGSRQSRLENPSVSSDLVSATAKWGVLAQITLFRLFLESLNSAGFSGSSNS